MPWYLILANQTAASPELTSAIREIVEKKPDAEFVLLVPATPVEDLLDWQDADSETVATRTADAAKKFLESNGAKVADASPVKAIENELNREKQKYDGIIISTLPLQRSRWVALDQPRRIERRFKLTVKHVVSHSVTMTREELINGLNEDLNLELEALLRSVCITPLPVAVCSATNCASYSRRSGPASSNTPPCYGAKPVFFSHPAILRSLQVCKL